MKISELNITDCWNILLAQSLPINLHRNYSSYKSEPSFLQYNIWVIQYNSCKVSLAVLGWNTVKNEEETCVTKLLLFPMAVSRWKW